MNIIDKRNSIRKHPTKKPSTRTINQITHIAIHHSLTLSGSAEAFANYHVGTNDWSVMGYHYVVNKDGSIDWCSDHTVVTPHVGNHNRYSLGICMVGDFRTQQPTEKQYEATLWLVNHLQKQLPNKCQIWGHSQYSGYQSKQCPVIDMNKFRKDVEEFSKPKVTVQSQQPKYPSARVKFEGKSVEALLIDNTTQIWTRDIATLLGVPVDFANGHVILNGITIPKEDVVLIDGKSYMHSRKIATYLNLRIDWEQSTSTVTLSK